MLCERFSERTSTHDTRCDKRRSKSGVSRVSWRARSAPLKSKCFLHPKAPLVREAPQTGTVTYEPFSLWHWPVTMLCVQQKHAHMNAKQWICEGRIEIFKSYWKNTKPMPSVLLAHSPLHQSHARFIQRPHWGERYMKPPMLASYPGWFGVASLVLGLSRTVRRNLLFLNFYKL